MQSNRVAYEKAVSTDSVPLKSDKSYCLKINNETKISHRWLASRYMHLGTTVNPSRRATTERVVSSL